MKDIPVIFSAPMIRQLLEGRKTRTRRRDTSPLARANCGERLWVRESFSRHLNGEGCWYWADGNVADQDSERPRPSIFMPRWASRITLTVTERKFERLHDITEDEALAEGAPKLVMDDDGRFYESENGTYRCGFAGLWDHLHGNGAWDENPRVVALTFEVSARNIDEVQK